MIGRAGPCGRVSIVYVRKVRQGLKSEDCGIRWKLQRWWVGYNSRPQSDFYEADTGKPWVVEEKDGVVRDMGLELGEFCSLWPRDGCWGYVGSRVRAARWVSVLLRSIFLGNSKG